MQYFGTSARSAPAVLKTNPSEKDPKSVEFQLEVNLNSRSHCCGFFHVSIQTLFTDTASGMLK